MGSSIFDTHRADIIVQGTLAIPAANTELPLWDSSKVKPGENQMDLTVAADTYFNSCPHVKGVQVVVQPTVQGVTVKLYWRLGGTWVVMNGSGNGETVAAAARYAKVLPCGGDGTKIAIASGATPPTTLVTHARLRDNSDAIVIP